MSQDVRMKPKVSIIIPVYNVGSHLRPCLDSAIGQTLHEIEIICINDGSTDGSPELLRTYKDKDPRILLIDQPNGGVSSARNAGLDIARGDYIRFLDGDDMLAPDACRMLVERAEQDRADIVLSSIRNLTSDGSLIDEYIIPDAFFDLERTADLRAIYSTHLNRGIGWPFYRRRSIENIRSRNSTYVQDALFYVDALIQARRITTLSAPLYYYTQHTGSNIMHDFNITAVIEIQTARVLIIGLLTQLDRYDRIRDIVRGHRIRYALFGFGDLLSTRDKCDPPAFHDLWRFWYETYRPLLCDHGVESTGLRLSSRVLFWTRSFRVFHALYTLFQLLRNARNRWKRLFHSAHP